MESLQSNKQDLLRKYLNDNISIAERHELEKMALDDLFLFEAMEGYSKSAKSGIPKLDSRTAKQSRFSINKYYAVAASFLVLIGAIFLLRPRMTNVEMANNNVQEEASEKYANVPVTPSSDVGTVLLDSKEVVTEEKTYEAEQDLNNKNETPAELASPRTRIAESDASVQIENQDISLNSQDKKTNVIAEAFEIDEDTDLVDQTSIEAEMGSDDMQNSAVIEVEGGASDQGAISNSVDEPQDNIVLDGVAIEPLKQEKHPPIAVVSKKREQRPHKKAEANVLTGIVSSETGEPLIGASIHTDDGSFGVVTDFDGKFEIPLALDIDSFVLSYTGFKSYEFSLDDLKQDSNLVLEEFALLEEVVVSGVATGNRFQENASPTMGFDNFAEYISDAISDIEACAGKVSIQFDINTEGELQNFKILESINDACDQQAIRILREGGTWSTIPLRRQVQYSYDIIF